MRSATTVLPLGFRYTALPYAACTLCYLPACYRTASAAWLPYTAAACLRCYTTAWFCSYARTLLPADSALHHLVSCWFCYRRAVLTAQNTTAARGSARIPPPRYCAHTLCLDALLRSSAAPAAAGAALAAPPLPFLPPPHAPAPPVYPSRGSLPRLLRLACLPAAHGSARLSGSTRAPLPAAAGWFCLDCITPPACWLVTRTPIRQHYTNTLPFLSPLYLLFWFGSAFLMHTATRAFLPTGLRFSSLDYCHCYTWFYHHLYIHHTCCHSLYMYLQHI